MTRRLIRRAKELLAENAKTIERVQQAERDELGTLVDEPNYISLVHHVRMTWDDAVLEAMGEK